MRSAMGWSWIRVGMLAALGDESLLCRHPRPLRHGCQPAVRRIRRSELGLLLELAEVLDHTAAAAGLARYAGVAAMQDQPVVGVLAELLRHVAQQLLLHFDHVLALGDAGAVGDPEDMGVHGDGGLAEGGVENDVGGLADR